MKILFFLVPVVVALALLNVLAPGVPPARKSTFEKAEELLRDPQAPIDEKSADEK